MSRYSAPNVMFFENFSEERNLSPWFLAENVLKAHKLLSSLIPSALKRGEFV
jgi:hypothetical protein